MAWETRARGGRYYTRSHKRNGRVVREYIGGGAAGEYVSLIDQIARERRELSRFDRQAECERRAPVDALLRTFCDDVELWARAALVAAGYHRHDRGEWRKRRG